MAADGTVNIDVILNDQASEKAKQIDTILKGIGDNAGEKIDDQIGQELNKAVDKTEKAHDKMGEALKKPVKQKVDTDTKEAEEKTIKLVKRYKDLPDEVKTKLIADAQKAGIENFDHLLKKVPKKVLTELATKAQRGEVIDYEALLKKVPAKILTNLQVNDNASPALRKIKQEADSTASHFTSLKEIVAGTFIGGLMTRGISMITGAMGGLVHEAMNASDAIYKFKSTMKLGGFGSDEIKSATAEMKKYADQTVYDLGDVAKTTAQLAANGIKNYMELTEAAGNLNAQAGGSAETFKSVAMVMTQTAGAGKLTTENWNQLADAIPGASGVLQKAMKDNGAYTGNFRDAMANGEITAKEFNKAVTQLGMNKGAIEAAKSTETFEGAFGNLEANVIDGLNKMINAIGKKRMTDMINAASDAVVKLTGFVLKMFSALAEHKQIAVGLAAVLTGLFATRKIIDFIGALGQAKRAMIEFGLASEAANALGGGAGGLGRTAAGAVGLGSRALSFAGKAVPVAAATMAIGSELTSKNSTSQKIGGSAGAVAGTALGAFAGSFMGPAGTAIGSAAGSWLGTKIGEKAGEFAQKALKGKTLVASTKIKIDSDTNNLSNKLSPNLNKLNKLTIKAEIDQKSINDTKAKTDQLFASMSKSVDKYYADKEKKAQKDLQQLVKQGMLTQAEADKRLKKMQQADQKEANERKKSLDRMQRDTNAHYRRLEAIQNGSNAKLQKIAQKYGTDSKKYQDALHKALEKENKRYSEQLARDQMNANSKVTKSVSKGADEQRKILQKLSKDKGKLSLQDLKQTEKDAKKQYEAAVKPAQKARDDIIKAAKDKHKQTIKIADEEYKKHHSISKKQYTDIVNDADKQRDDTIKAAKDQYNKVTKSAEDQHKKVVHEVESQKNEVVMAANGQATGHAQAAANEYSMVNKNVSSGSSRTASIWNKLGAGINKVLKVFEASQSVPMLTEAYATGTGALVNDQLALVGEEGFELAHTPRGIEVLGKEGPEIRYLSAGTSILTHEQSKQVMALNGGKLPGYAKGTGAKIADFVSGALDSAGDMLEEAFDFIGKSATEIWDKIKNSIGLDRLLDALPRPWLNQTYGKGSIRIAEHSVGNFLKKMADKFMEKIGAMGVSEGLIRAAASLMKVSLSAGDVSHIMNVIQHESGGRANAINGWDSNAKKGTPSKGILQYIDPTFQTYAMPGHTNIWSPLDQLIALFNDSTWRSDLKLGGWGPTGGRRFALGGWADRPSIFGEVPGEPEVAINPRRNTADGLIVEAIEARAQVDPNGLAGRLAKTITAAKQQAAGLLPSASLPHAGQILADNRQNSGSAAQGDIKLAVQLDGNTIARVVYPIQKAFQAQEIIVHNNGGAVPVGRAMPVGGAF